MNSRPRALLFDLDNTLTVRRASVEKLATLFAEDHREQLLPIELEQLRAILLELDQGGYNPRRAQELCERLPWRRAPTPAVIETYWQRRFADAVVAREGLDRVLAWLDAAGFALGVVTNGGVVGQHLKLDRLGIRSRLQTTIVSEAAGCKKPEARIFRLACDELGLAPGDCWFVGDHPENDVLGALRFGMHPIWLSDEPAGHSWPVDPLGAEPGPPASIRRISSLLELIPLLEDL